MIRWIQGLYSEQDPQRSNVDMGARQVVFDCETDGLDPRKNRILSIGAVEIIDNRVQLATAWEVRVCRPHFDGGGAEVHELAKREMDSGVEEKEAIQCLIYFAGRNTLMGHYVSFDIALVQNAADRLGLQKLQNASFNTLEFMRKKFPEGLIRSRKSWPLGVCAERYGIPNVGAHTALGDAHMTALLFLAFRKGGE